MNYLIWNGNDSRDIKGLIISELPPISKPQMRVVETAIDGVDGSIIEELGYESYDKAISIGLTKNADIDEVVQYFNGTGEVIFSNEPYKYYKASIIGKIDYARLVRFRVATVTFRVQPFKYEYLEKQAVLPSGEIAGEVIQLTDKKITELAIDGRSTQSETPTPNSPVGIESIGTYNEETEKYEFEVKETGKNKLVLIDGTYTSKGITATVKNGIITLSGTSTETSFVSIKVKNNIIKNETYILSINNINTIDGTNDVRITDEVGEIVARTYFNKNTNSSVVFTYSTEIELNYIVVRTEANVTYNNFVIKPQIEKGSTATEWQIGKINTSLIMLDEPLRSLPNGVKDIAHIKGNKLYIDRYIGSSILNGTEAWVYTRKDANKNTFLYQTDYKNKADNKNINVISSYFVGYNADDLWQQDIVGISLNANGNIQISCNFETSEVLKSFLSNNNVAIVYKLEKPYTEIAGELSTLELFADDNTNTNSINNSENANMAISYVDNKMIVNNVGNYKAKPVIEIKGSGAVQVAVNGNTLFRYTFPENEDTVIIDAQKQDAYLGAVLKNRNMIGEFPIFEIGKNTITWDGVISSIKISSKSRWL